MLICRSQKKDLEAEIEKFRKEQKQLIRNLKSQPLEGNPGLEIHYGPGPPIQKTSQSSRPTIEELVQVTRNRSTHLMQMMSTSWQTL